MKKTAICFSDKGRAVIEKLNGAAAAAGIDAAGIHMCPEEDLDTLVKDAFSDKTALIFTGAVGIAVRAISGFVKDKLTDSPVIVIDDNGRFVIPILSGHAGGANKLAVAVAKLLDAIPVITTATDAEGAFSPDVFATENHLTVRNRDGIKKVSAKALEGKAVTISIKDYPPKDPVDIIIADETDREYSLLLSPKKYVVGVGTRRDKDPAKAEQFILSAIAESGADISDVYAVATIDIKQNEPAIRAFSQKHRIPVIAFEASVLKRVKGEFSSSAFVEDTVGVDNVCERAAVLAAGANAKLVCRKRCGEGITVAIAQRVI